MHIIDILPRIQTSHVTIKNFAQLLFPILILSHHHALLCCLKQQIHCFILCVVFIFVVNFHTDNSCILRMREFIRLLKLLLLYALASRVVVFSLIPCMGFKEGAFPVCTWSTAHTCTLWKLLHALLCLDFLVSLFLDGEATEVEDVPNRLPFLLTPALLSFGC